MKDNSIFFNPFRLISPKLDSEASRLAHIYESTPKEMTCLEEGLLVMVSKLYEMTDLLHKILILPDKEKIEQCAAVAAELHDEEKALTHALVCSPLTTGDVLKAVLLFPAKLERCGDLMESVLNVAKIKAREGLPFTDKAHKELEILFDSLREVIREFGDLLATLDPAVMENLLPKFKKVTQLTLDFALTHEDRLIGGFCAPKASSLYIDILDSVRSVNRNLREMTQSLKDISVKYQQ